MEQTKEKTIWEKVIGDKPFVISGPCSAETKEQVIDTSLRLAKTGKVDMLRAGIWKPRTKPGNFEGVGAEGLSWLEEAKKLTGLPVTTEVANGSHVEEALKHDIDMLWLGARTTVNPFSVQEIADALQGVDIPVLIKNPINPDLQLWIGGIERIQQAGVKQVGVIHRGFSNFGNTNYRNAPMWHIPIELKRTLPEIPIICDPSHICGRRDNLQQISQKALDLDYQGIMLESHMNPDEAWSDAKQQITPEQVGKMIEDLVWRHETSDKEEFISALAKFREQINQIDDEILTLLSNRMKIAEKIGQYKKDNDITILQNTRWNEILENGIAKGKKLGLSKKFILKHLDAVHIESISHQDKVMNKE